MSNSQQKEIQDNFISERISKWVNAHQRNTSKKKKTKQTKGFFSNQKNRKYSEEHNANQKEYKSTRK